LYFSTEGPPPLVTNYRPEAFLLPHFTGTKGYRPTVKGVL